MTSFAEVRGAVATLADSLKHVSPVTTWAEIRFGLPECPPDEWWTCSDLLAEPARFDHWRSELARWLEDRYGDAPERTTAGYVLGWYLLVPGYAAGLLFHAARRVPSLRPADLAFQLGEDRPHPVGIALLSSEFACLPEDPGADLPEATAVRDEQALAELLRARFTAHANQFVQAFGPTTRFGRRTLWAAATDALDKAAWMAGKALGDEAAGVADSALLLPARMAPFTSGSTLRQEPGGWTRDRQSCCFHYAIAPGQPVCSTCPRAPR
ncbi:(2Fe-2S)-binding protein [Kutzneria viridogrisea]|uniref:Ferric siderophore reductase C-terminal domain-containing protein n=2 Tax=Kutzneria TaxID=43356 RepID=W5W6F8_9PSEU|nr:(2Fe-2S)-binding protein [Kutzneria albida]AHH93764.1 hypothetical protein KALB_387 [Kutzneria albida DSM 43870]MBA8931232.1 hypothetical protein [Kutzneria viridogrisea]